MDSFKLLDRCDFACPFCGKLVTTGKMASGSVALAHDLPMCRSFEELPPLNFVHQAYQLVLQSQN